MRSEVNGYIDAHAGGPGKGWFRVVTSPAEARRFLGADKLVPTTGRLAEIAAHQLCHQGPLLDKIPHEVAAGNPIHDKSVN